MKGRIRKTWPCPFTQKRRKDHLGDLNHKGTGENREARQERKLPFLADSCDLETVSTQQGWVGLDGESAQPGAIIHPPAVRNAVHLMLGQSDATFHSGETTVTPKVQWDTTFIQILGVHPHSFQTPNVVTPLADLVVLISLPDAEDNHQYGNNT